MKFLIDAQLPRRLARQIQNEGHDAIHTLDLPERNRTDDDVLRELAAQDSRVLVSKDSDFVDSHILHGKPPHLLLVTTGNITNEELAAIFAVNLPTIIAAFESAVFVEVDRTGLTIRS